MEQFCNSEGQLEIIRLLNEGKTVAEIGGILKKDAANIRRSISLIEGRALKAGYSPDHDWNHPVPDGHKIKGVSTYYNEDGKPVAQWVKSQVDLERQQEIMQEAISAMAEDIKPLKPKKLKYIPRDDNLLNCYVITDYHMGMLSWHEETSADWNLDIAESTLVAWFATAIQQAPSAKECIFAQLGDFLHFDSLEAVTPQSRHILDADTRFQKIIRCCIRVIRQVIDMLLDKYELVHIKWCDANHDPAGSAWMREFLVALYDKEPRISVDNSPDTYYAFEWGKTAIFFHHGHKRKVKNVDTVFAAKFRDLFGKTEHAYAHMGHFHSIDKVETNLMVVEQHRTLAAPDAYASKGGWLSGREANVITYHKEYGQVACNTISHKMVAQ